MARDDDVWHTVATAIGQQTQATVRITGTRAVSGGCINAAYRADTEAGGPLFVKLGNATEADGFAAEGEGLAALAATQTIRVPRPIAWGAAGGRGFLATEFLELGHRSAPRVLGEALAALHAAPASPGFRARFGWHRDNRIGATAQANTPHHDWLIFFAEQRLGTQLTLAAQDGAPRQLIDDGHLLAGRIEGLFGGYRPRPSLLHGDLWGGNQSGLADGTPVIFDPAVYYGDREADLAMTELFGGFSAEFYAAYDAAWPRDPGYRVRRELYNLYHVLNHHHLFGGGYAGQAHRMIKRLLAETG